MKHSPTIRWVDPINANIPAGFTDQLGLSSMAAYGLVRRGIDTLQAAKAFLSPQYYQPADPKELPDLELGVTRLVTAIRNKEWIGVWGDFDVDGQTSTTLLVEVLRELGAKVSYHIPIREQESHGVNLPNFRRLLESGVQLVLTCDTGISAHEAVTFSRSRGVDFIISDHHQLPDPLPDAFAVINPQRLPDHHPMRSHAGVGTAYQIVRELCLRFGRQELAEAQLDLVALGTIADLALLNGDTRYYVQRGLSMLRTPRRTGLAKLMQMAEVNPANLNEEHISFSIAPRLNALGRLADANPIVDFLTTSDSNTAAVFAARLEGLNAERRFLTEQVFQGAISQLDQDPAQLDQPVIILSHHSWPGGVVGIVASRLVELFQRPVILLSGAPGQPLRGSARSVDGVDITAAIASAADLLIGFGGHPMAAGMAIAPENLPVFRRRLAADIIRQMGEKPPVRELIIDAYLELEDISLDLVTELDRLAPFGPGNPPFILVTRDLKLLDTNPIGKSGEHLVALVENTRGETRRVTWWQGARNLLPQGPFDLAFTLRANDFRGQPEIQLEWIAAREISQPVITLPSLAPAQEIIDLRFTSDPLAELNLLSIQKDILAWADHTQQLPYPRITMPDPKPADTLLIWNPPPARAELQWLIEAVRPKQIILCNATGVPDEPRAFLEQLAGMVRFALKKRSGRVNLAQLAVALNQPLISIELGLYWLVARGFVRIITRSEYQIILAEGGIPNHTDISRLQTHIQLALQEAAAFRAWYRRADAQRILS